MFCYKCGTKAEDGMVFCANCGTRLQTPEENGAPVPTPKAIPADPVYSAPVQPAAAPEAGYDPAEQPVGIPEPGYHDSVEAGYYPPVQPPAPKKKSPVKLIIILAAAVVVAAAAIWLIISLGGRAALQKQLLRDWSRVEESDGTYYRLVLDFSEDEVEYIFEGIYFEDTIDVFEYEVIGRNKIRTEWGSDHTIEFDDEKEMIIVSPALTSTDSVEYWFNFD